MAEDHAEAVTLSPFDAVPFVGSVEVQVRQGAICVLGHPLHPSDEWHTLHSPAGGALLVLQTVAGVSSDAELLLRRPVDAQRLPRTRTIDAGGGLRGRSPGMAQSKVAANAASGKAAAAMDGQEGGEDGEEEAVEEEDAAADDLEGGCSDEDDAGGDGGHVLDQLVSAICDDGEMNEADEGRARRIGSSSVRAGVGDGRAGCSSTDGQAAIGGAVPSWYSELHRVMHEQLGLGVLPPPDAATWTRGALLPSAWDDVAEEVKGGGEGGAVVLLCGPRNSGKSTLARFLLNRLISSTARPVGYLECDIGQAEFTPPGLVSLHYVASPTFGPPHTHLRDAAGACFVGDASPAADPSLYLRCIRRLCDQHRANNEHNNGTPLVVNTCGWVGGFGKQLLADIVHALRPTHVAILDRRGHEPSQSSSSAPPLGPSDLGIGPGSELSPRVLRADALINACHVERVGRAPPPSPPAADARALALLAYFDALPAGAHALPRQDGGHSGGYAGGEWHRALCRLVSACPYAVSLDQMRVCVMHATVTPSELLGALNASIVGLACYEPAADDTSEHNNSDRTAATPTMPGVMLPRPAPACACIGLGLVRAVDPTAGTLFLITPVGEDDLARVSLLLRGTIEVPAALLQPTVLTAVSPYLAADDLRATGANAMGSRHNIKRGHNADAPAAGKRAMTRADVAGKRTGQ